MKTTLEFMLDKIAKKRYNEKYKYCTKKQQMQCLICILTLNKSDVIPYTSQ